MIRAGAERLASLSVLGLRIWIVIGILLRVTRLRDRFDPLAIVFYTTPWPVIAGGFAIVAIHYWRSGSLHRMRRYIALAGGALFVWLALSWHSAPSPTEAPQIRICFWNVSEADKLRPWMAKWLRNQDVDVIALAEPGTFRPGVVEAWQSEFPAHTMGIFGGDLLLLVRGKVLGSESGLLALNSYYTLSDLRVRGRSFTLLHVDLYAGARASRREPLHALTELVRKHGEKRLVVLGDFNTPRDSAHLDPIRGKLINCFEQAGRGLIETWPGPLPLLSLDQVWSSRHLRVLSCRIGGPLLSDHRAVTVDLQGW